MYKDERSKRNFGGEQRPGRALANGCKQDLERVMTVRMTSVRVREVQYTMWVLVLHVHTGAMI